MKKITCKKISDDEVKSYVAKYKEGLLTTSGIPEDQLYYGEQELLFIGRGMRVNRFKKRFLGFLHEQPLAYLNRSFWCFHGVFAEKEGEQELFDFIKTI